MPSPPRRTSEQAPQHFFDEDAYRHYLRYIKQQRRLQYLVSPGRYLKLWQAGDHKESQRYKLWLVWFYEPPTLPPLAGFRHFVEARFPVLYVQVVEPTLSDLYQEYYTALAEGHPVSARWVLLRGCVALAAAAICQHGFSFLSRIAALWQARSSK